MGFLRDVNIQPARKELGGDGDPEKRLARAGALLLQVALIPVLQITTSVQGFRSHSLLPETPNMSDPRL